MEPKWSYKGAAGQNLEPQTRGMGSPIKLGIVITLISTWCKTWAGVRCSGLGMRFGGLGMRFSGLGMRFSGLGMRLLLTYFSHQHHPQGMTLRLQVKTNSNQVLN